MLIAGALGGSGGSGLYAVVGRSSRGWRRRARRRTVAAAGGELRGARAVLLAAAWTGVPGIAVLVGRDRRRSASSSGRTCSTCPSTTGRAARRGCRDRGARSPRAASAARRCSSAGSSSSGPSGRSCGPTLDRAIRDLGYGRGRLRADPRAARARRRAPRGGRRRRAPHSSRARGGLRPVRRRRIRRRPGVRRAAAGAAPVAQQDVGRSSSGTSLGAAVGVALFAPGLVPAFGAAYTVALVPLVAVGSVWGDLLESAVKREAGVKDAATWLPGFGGILDRIDSLLITIALAYWVAAPVRSCDEGHPAYAAAGRLAVHRLPQCSPAKSQRGSSDRSSRGWSTGHRSTALTHLVRLRGTRRSSVRRTPATSTSRCSGWRSGRSVPAAPRAGRRGGLLHREPPALVLRGMAGCISVRATASRGVGVVPRRRSASSRPAGASSSFRRARAAATERSVRSSRERRCSPSGPAARCCPCASSGPTGSCHRARLCPGEAGSWCASVRRSSPAPTRMHERSRSGWRRRSGRSDGGRRDGYAKGDGGRRSGRRAP